MPSATQYDPKPLPFKNSLIGISDKAMQIHHDKLYVGYVAKKNEIGEELKKFATGQKPLDGANQTYSELRALKDGETFATNGVYLHEYYFNVLGGDPSTSSGRIGGSLVDALVAKHSSIEQFIAYFSACGMASRGWVVLAWDTHEGRLKMYSGDTHNQGGVWGAIPIIVLDVYEHAYFMDYGSDRKKYIEDFWKNLNWEAANAVYERAKGIAR
jgi:Fe-Mn family superoxide dismutase